MRIWEKVYYVLIGIISLNLLVFHVLDLIKADFIAVSLLVLLILLPLINKISSISYKGTTFTLSDKDAAELKEGGNKVLSEEQFEQAQESKSELEYLVEELVSLGNYDFNLGLVAIRIKLEQLIREILKLKFTKEIDRKKKGFSPGALKWNAKQMSKRLFERRIIDRLTYDLLRRVLYLGNKAAHGLEVGDENSEILYETALKLVVYLYDLRDDVKASQKRR